MPRKSGLEAIGEITRENPQARILVLTGLAEEEARLAIQAGALGYLPKGALPQQVLCAIQDAYLTRMANTNVVACPPA
jgi:two-component system invasion response regulator UvrY